MYPLTSFFYIQEHNELSYVTVFEVVNDYGLSLYHVCRFFMWIFSDQYKNLCCIECLLDDRIPKDEVEIRYIATIFSSHILAKLTNLMSFHLKSCMMRNTAHCISILLQQGLCHNTSLKCLNLYWFNLEDNHLAILIKALWQPASYVASPRLLGKFVLP
jgi:hypothetical protein